MRSFIATALGFSASMFGVLGAVALVIFALASGAFYHWACFGLLLLVPMWMAAAEKIMDWSIDFERGYRR